MRSLKSLLAVSAIGLSLTACAALQDFETKFSSAVSVVSQASVAPKDAYIAINVFDGVEATATGYNRWPRCTGSNGPICRDRAVRLQIRKVVLAGRVARNDVKAYLRSHPGQSIAIRSFDDMKAATSSLQAIIAQYKIN